MKCLCNIRNHGPCVCSLRYRVSNMNNSQKSRFFKNSFKKPMKPIFLNFFQQKYSLGSCATFSENMVSIFILDFDKICLTSLKSWQMSRNLRKKKQNSTIWAPCKARAPKIAKKSPNIRFFTTVLAVL